MSTMSGSRKTTKINSSHQWQLRSSLKNSNFNPIHLKATIFRAQVVIKSVPVRILNLSTKLVLSSCSMTQWSSGRRQRESKRSALITHLACPLTWRPKAIATNYVVALDISPALRGPACAIFKPIFFFCFYYLYCNTLGGLLWISLRELARKIQSYQSLDFCFHAKSCSL